MKKYFETKENSIESAAYKAAETKIEKKELEKLKEPKTYLGFKENSLADVIKNVVVEETEYQKMFKKELEKAGKSIPQMSDAEKKSFFDKIDTKYKAKNEGATDKEIDKFHKSLDKLVHKSFGHSSDEKKKMDEELTAAQKKLPPALQKAIAKKMSDKKEEVKEKVDNAYAVGMAAAMKQTGDTPPLKKSTITKAHDIAKSIEKDQKESVKETHTIYKDKANQKQKDAEGEETPKKFKDIRKENKRKTDIGTEKTPVDMEPNVNFKN